MAGEFLVEIKKEFGREDEKTVKVAELKRLSKQEGKTMKEFVQEFRRAVKDSRYERRSLVEEFKRGMNKIICQRLMMLELKDNGLGFILFYFLLYFIIDHKVKKTKCDTIIGHMKMSHKSHAHMI